jgi:hypothetical protein
MPSPSPQLIETLVASTNPLGGGCPKANDIST